MTSSKLIKRKVACSNPATAISPISYDYEDVLRTVVIRGKQLYGKTFRIFKEDKPTILRLLYWFLQDESQAEEEGMDLHKGILLTGPIGCGKSAIMKVICSLCVPSWKFVIKSCPQLALDFAQKGYGIIDRYTQQSFTEKDRPLTVCFDDLGSESIIPQYGFPFNTMAGIFSIRYDLFVEHNMLTHITTHLSAAELEGRYGSRFTSQASQLFNRISFPADSQNKRKL